MLNWNSVELCVETRDTTDYLSQSESVPSRLVTAFSKYLMQAAQGINCRILELVCVPSAPKADGVLFVLGTVRSIQVQTARRIVILVCGMMRIFEIYLL